MAYVSEGGCLCGAIRFRVSAPPLALSRCHCRSCRLAAGAPAVAWAIFSRNDFAFLQGEEQLRRFRSSPAVVRTFCSICGTSISYEPADAPGQIELTSATFDQPDRFPPTREVWIKHRLTWQPLDLALRHYPQASSSASTEGAA
jgi:hypothetical protein